VSMLIEKLDPPKPPHSTVSSVFRILEKKGFLSHKAYGRTYEYHSIITKEEYSGRNIKDLVKNYFQGSAQNLVSFLVKDLPPCANNSAWIGGANWSSLVKP